MQLNLDNYNELLSSIDNISVERLSSQEQKDLRQTVLFLIYQIQIPLGEIQPVRRLNRMQRLVNFLGLTQMTPEKLWLHEKESMHAVPDTIELHKDKEILIHKLKKLILVSEDFLLQQHPFYGKLSKDKYLHILFKMIRTHLKKFEIYTYSENSVFRSSISPQ